MSTNALTTEHVRSPSRRVGIPPASETLQAQLDDAAELILENDSFLIASHEFPDGDAIGASLALMHLLESLGKEVVVFNVDPVPWNFSFLPGADRLVTTLAPTKEFDVTCVLDCSTADRVGERFPDNGWADRVLCIDHHRGPFNGADVLVHDRNAASVGELVFRLADTLDVEIDRPMAEAIYCSLMTDTGSFRYSNTSPVALSMAAALVDAGVDVWQMTSNVYESNPAERVSLLARVLETLQLSGCGRLATVRVTREMLTSTGATESMLDGFINHARSIRGVEVAAQIKELGNSHFYVSFRSRGRVNVGRIAEHFGGGGHQNAAGCTISGDPQEIVEALAESLAEVMSIDSIPRDPR